MKLVIDRPKYKDCITVEHKSDDLSVDEIVERLVRPALLGLGFHADSIVDVIGEVDYEAISDSDEFE